MQEVCNVPTAIAVTREDLALPSPDRQTPPAVVLHSPEPDKSSRAAKGRAPQGDYSLEQSLAEMYGLLEQHGYVIALYPASLPAAAIHRLHAVRSVLESDRIALLGLDLPPLGVAALALQLRQLSICDFSPGVLASAARLLSHYVYAGAVLGSVTKLDRVPVSLKSHAKSWVPGTQFAVLANPEPQLTKLGGSGSGSGSGSGGGGGGRSGSGRSRQEAVLAGPDFSTHLLTASGQLQSDWVTQTLAPSWQVQGIGEVPLPAESARWWATGKLIEFAAAIPDISVLYQLVASVRREECRWCGLELIGDRCGFCSSPLLPPENQRAPRGVLASGA
ncbi:hypothetical protein U9R90_12275 [Streptomyces sp. E11-3]|uniref:hypothetical protein n=1 Tax=Streptomyces sp. E11-3 TaxID=3110112 RepID=UPI00397EB8FE